MSEILQCMVDAAVVLVILEVSFNLILCLAVIIYAMLKENVFDL